MVLQCSDAYGMAKKRLAIYNTCTLKQTFSVLTHIAVYEGTLSSVFSHFYKRTTVVTSCLLPSKFHG